MKPKLSEPQTIFPDWQKWEFRGSTIQTNPFDDPPRNFDISGIYLLGHFTNKLQMKTGASPVHLNPHVIYIGMSKQTTIRLEGRQHEKVKKLYREIFGDKGYKYLYFTIWSSGWSNWSLQNSDLGRVKMAFLRYYERKLLWEYALKYGRLPVLNKL